MHVRLLYIHDIQSNCWIDGDVGVTECFADNLLVDLAIGGYVNDKIALYCSLTAESTPLYEGAVNSLIPGFNFRALTQMRQPGDDLVLGKFAFGADDLAAPTQAATTTDRVQINTQVTGSLQH